MLYYNVFGSEDSLDIDVMVRLKGPVSVQASKVLCKQYEERLRPFFDSDKEININLCTVKDGSTTWVAKGTPDECNNSILDTYDLHEQHHPLLVRNRMERNVELKIARAMRTILQMASKSEYRGKIKSALKSHDALSQMACLKGIDFATLTELNKPNVNLIDYRKAVAFQIGQTVALLVGAELYTKQSIIEFFRRKHHLLAKSIERFLCRRETNPQFESDSDLNTAIDILLDEIISANIIHRNIKE